MKETCLYLIIQRLSLRDYMDIVKGSGWQGGGTSTHTPCGENRWECLVKPGKKMSCRASYRV